MDQKLKVVCFDVGGTQIKAGILDVDGLVIEKKIVDTQATSIDQFMRLLMSIIEEFSETHDIAGIGLSFPGFINHETGDIPMAGALRKLYGMNIKHEFAKYTSLPVSVENDANCAALAEKLSGNAVDLQDFAVFTIGTGIGGAIFVENKLYRGHRFAVGEFGHMIVDHQAHPYASLHDLCSTSALVARVYEATGEKLNGREIFAKVDDPMYYAIVEGWISYLALGVYNLMSAVNPETILIGGGVSANPLVLEILKEKLQQFPMWHTFYCEVDVCKHYNDAGMIGACYSIAKELN